MSDLGTILNDAPEQPIEAEREAQVERTGEEQQAPPAEQEDPHEKRFKGLEAAAAAERRKRQEAETRSQQLEREIQALKQPKLQEEGAPDPQKFQDNPQEYWRQLAKYEARQELKQALAQEKEQQALERQQQAFMSAVSTLNGEGRGKYQDFDDVINGGLGPVLTPALQQAIVFKGGAEVAYYLGKNPAEASRIGQLHPADVLLEIGELRGMLKHRSAPSAPDERSLPQTLTQARDARGRFQERAYDGPTPLDDILKR